MTKSVALARIRQTAASAIPEGGRAILYGSRARGDARKDSDWDILSIYGK
jgi:predicted nucleotidyltransferase